MGLLLDIVPNHMAANTENPWWRDVLKNGRASPYADYFDIDWHPATGNVPKSKVLLPILGAPYQEEFQNQRLALECHTGGFYIVVNYTIRLPIAPTSYAIILEVALALLRNASNSTKAALSGFEELCMAFRHITGDANRRQRIASKLEARLGRLYLVYPEIKSAIDGAVSLFNGVSEQAEGFALLDKLLSEQAYVLAYWREESESINYRRFFDISGLVSLRTEEPIVFEATHSLVLDLIERRMITGLRIDHVDGLYDPLGYLQRLQRAIKQRIGEIEPFYIVVEKIVLGDESLPEEWPVSGTTGYEFIRALNGVFVDARGLSSVDATYRKFSGVEHTFDEIVYEGKEQLLRDHFSADVRTLAYQLADIADHDLGESDFKLDDYTLAIVKLTACLPIYRTYIRDYSPSVQDRSYIEWAIAQTRSLPPILGEELVVLLRRVLLLQFPPQLSDGRKEVWLRFVIRWQQLSGPAMAKGLEDTAFYVYNRLISLNDVGGGPSGAVISEGITSFHRYNLQQLERSPHSLNATSTHDTKRSEDVRARINVLSELAEGWDERVRRWSLWNNDKKTSADDALLPDPNDEVFLYQTLLGAWPLASEDMPTFEERMKKYMEKAAREAKVHTSWTARNEKYEHALEDFLTRILTHDQANPFLKDFLSFQAKVAYYGALNSLAQCLLKIASPSVPDFYRGTELWDFSLVDPDNRRPVDFKKRQDLLRQIEEPSDTRELLDDLVANWLDGRIKLYTIAKALKFRNSYQNLFLHGDYRALAASGSRAKHIAAFGRCNGGAWALAVAPRLTASLCEQRTLPLGEDCWEDTAIALPAEAANKWLNVLSHETVMASCQVSGKVLYMRDVFRRFPIALLTNIGS